MAGWPASWAFAVASGGRVGTAKKAESQASEDQATCFSLPPSREEIFRAPVVLKGGGTGRDTEHSGSVKDSAELCLNSRMLLLGPLTPQTSEQTAFSATDSHKPL